VAVPGEFRTILITHWVPDEVVARLQRYGTVVANPTRESWPRGEVLARVRDADAMLAFMPDCVDAAFLGQCPRLAVIAGALKGCDNFDVDACTHRGVWLTIVPGLLTVPTAELAVSLLLALARHVLSGDRLIRAGAFDGWRPIWARADRAHAIPPRLLVLADRTVFTPHLGSAVDDVRRAIALEAADNIIDVFEGRRPRGAVNSRSR
jgi:lactate dehydrogenase-like 2-hydroxyacid dehydrogenase